MTPDLEFSGLFPMYMLKNLHPFVQCSLFQLFSTQRKFYLWWVSLELWVRPATIKTSKVSVWSSNPTFEFTLAWPLFLGLPVRSLWLGHSPDFLSMIIHLCLLMICSRQPQLSCRCLLPYGHLLRCCPLPQITTCQTRPNPKTSLLSRTSHWKAVCQGIF